MLNNTFDNQEAAKKIAKALEPIDKEVVFVGGAVVSLYTNDPAAENVRMTKDIDITLEIASFRELETLRENLEKIGFQLLEESFELSSFLIYQYFEEINYVS